MRKVKTIYRRLARWASRTYGFIRDHSDVIMVVLTLIIVMLSLLALG